MDPSSKLHLTRLRELIAAVRLEKSSLATEIASAATRPARRQFAIHRYSSLVNELRMAADELEKLIAAAKRSEGQRPLH
jgi:hypothetical protein